MPRGARDRRTVRDGTFRRNRRYYKTTVPGAQYERWEVDSGEDAPLTGRDLRIILFCGAAILLFAVIVAAVVTYVL